MQRLALVLFIGSELSFYLLIAQTGIVEYLNSDLSKVFYLPLGGLVGSVLAVFLGLERRVKLFMFLALQSFLSLFYPDFNSIALFLLGLCVGALAPLLIYELRHARLIELALALGFSYTLGTLLFTSEVAGRMPLAFSLSLLALFCLWFLPVKKQGLGVKTHFSLAVMSLWVFFDSALFESLSRNELFSIWRDGYTLEIVFFHLLGVLCACVFSFSKRKQEFFILALFSVSYLLYFLQEAMLLSMVYPFVISYYNVKILQSLLHQSLKVLGLYMVFIGWVASGMGLMVSLEHVLAYVPVMFFLALFVHVSKVSITKKEVYYV